jgi:hypothetical protein
MFNRRILLPCDFGTFSIKIHHYMQRLIIFSLLTFLYVNVNSQVSQPVQTWLSSEENLKAIANLSPYSPGGYGFDNRYEGVKGTPRLMDTLLPSFLQIKGQDYLIQVPSDIDLVNNALIYQHPKTKKLYSIPVDIISELIINKDGKELLFRTTFGKPFEKEMKEQRFYMVLKDGKCQFIKIPLKIFVQANYKGPYSADIRYDEYVPDAKYYLMGPDSIFHQVRLNKKSIIKVYPNRKKLIDQAAAESTFSDTEAMIISILEKF